MEPEIKVTVIESVEETSFPRSDTLSECFNNVDVGVPLWLTEPRDKQSRREFASSYPVLYVSAFHTNNSCMPLLS